MKAHVGGGRMEENGHPLGLANQDDVVRRAREIAETNGRLPEEYTEADLQQAKHEFVGLHSEDIDVDDLTPPPQVTEWTEVLEPDDNKTPTKTASDEQTAAERLVEEGVDEAAHDQML